MNRIPPRVLVLALVLCACSSAPKTALDAGSASSLALDEAKVAETVRSRGRPVNIEIPLGLPPLPLAESTRPSEDMVALGRRLFYEPNLSADGILSCAACHDPERRFTDGRQTAIGFGSTEGARNTPSLLNGAYRRELNWEGSAVAAAPLGVFEAQVRFPLEDPAQMATSTQELEKKMNLSEQYHLALQKTFGRVVAIKYVLAARVIAAFERTLLSGNSPFDRYLFHHEENAISASAARGWALFKDPQRGNCIACHRVEEKWALFTDDQYHNTGVGVDSSGEGRDLGRFRITQRNPDRGAFHTPSLRNVAETGPYMHNGSLRTLKQVVDFYSEGGNPNPYLDPLIKRVRFTDKEKLDLVAFLESLTGQMPPNSARPTARDLAVETTSDEKQP